MSPPTPGRSPHAASEGIGLIEAQTQAEIRLYRAMLLIRRFEEAAYRLFLDGEITGAIHQCQGQEAVPVGVCDALRPTDWITSTHRPHGHALAKGLETRVAMAELLMKRTGCCEGRCGSMHLGDPDIGMLPAIAIVAAGVALAPGLGLAFKLRGSDQVAACFFGEGATGEGAFHEGLNLAAVQKLPVVFVCENNLYGGSTAHVKASLVADVANRASGYGVLGVVVDGMDVLAVREASREAVARARAGEGPVLLECKTYRFAGHTRNDASTYRPDAEEARWKARDPLILAEERLRTRGIVDDVALREIHDSVATELRDAVDFARGSEVLPADKALAYVYAETSDSEV